MWNKQNKAKIRNVAHRQKQLRWIPFMKVRVGVLNSIINYMENNLRDSGALLQVGGDQYHQLHGEQPPWLRGTPPGRCTANEIRQTLWFRTEAVASARFQWCVRKSAYYMSFWSSWASESRRFRSLTCWHAKLFFSVGCKEYLEYPGISLADSPILRTARGGRRPQQRFFTCAWSVSVVDRVCFYQLSIPKTAAVILKDLTISVLLTAVYWTAWKLYWNAWQLCSVYWRAWQLLYCRTDRCIEGSDSCIMYKSLIYFPRYN